MIVSCNLTMIFSTSCFETFEMTSKVSDLPGGSALALFKTLGWVSISLFFIATVQFYVFKSWAGKQVKAYQQGGKSAALPNSV